MKKILIIAIALLTFSACQQSDSAKTPTTETSTSVPMGDAPHTKFEKTSYEFGTITQGEKVLYEFKFKNEGKTPLIITSAVATCGCTVPQYPVEPIKPGEEGKIKVVFDSTGKIGQQDKIVTITSNANPEMERLHLVGEVIEKSK